jgi:hypothetical protein
MLREMFTFTATKIAMPCGCFFCLLLNYALELRMAPHLHVSIFISYDLLNGARRRQDIARSCALFAISCSIVTACLCRRPL